MINHLKSINLHASVKNSFWIIGERVIQMILSFVITMVTARYLGPANYGVLNYGASFVAFFASVTKLGIDAIIVNELINNKSLEGKILGSSLFLRFISSILSMISILILIIIFKPGSKIILITTMLQSIALIFQALSLLDYWFQSKLQSKFVSIAKSCAYIIVSIYKVLLLVKKADVTWFAFATTLDYIIITVLLFYFYKKKNGDKLIVDIKFGMNLLKKSYHFIVSGLMIVIYTQIDKIMIGNMIDNTYVGYYSAALALHSIFNFIPDAIIVSSRPVIFNAKKHDKNLYYRRLKQTFAIIFWVCFIFAGLMSIFSKYAINILYGEEYMLARIPLIILVWSIPFAHLGAARSIWIVSEGYNKYTKKYIIWGSIVNIILNFFLIKKIGINGAAIATLITEIVVCIISPLMYKETRLFPKMVLKSIVGKFD